MEIRKERKRNFKSCLWIKKKKKKKNLIPPHPLTNFELQKYLQNEPRFNGVFQEISYLIT